jgi:tetratricopeptide (TPR) repeat protein
VEPDYATIHHNKGWLLNKIGHHKEAIACFKKALQIDPERPVTYENLADTYAKLGKYRAALKAYRQAVEMLKPSYGYIRHQIDTEIKRIASILSLSRHQNNHR